METPVEHGARGVSDRWDRWISRRVGGRPDLAHAPVVGADRNDMATGRSEARFLVHDSARPLKVRRLLQPLPAALESARSIAARLGLRGVDQHKVDLRATEMSFARIFALDPDRRWLCEVVGGFPADARAPVWQFVTILEGGRGVLLTTTLHPMPLSAGEIAQTLPNATPAELLAAHRAALEHLLSLGCTIVEATDAQATSMTAHHLLGQPGRTDPRATARTLRANLNEHRHAALGPIHTQPDLSARLATLR